MDFLCFKFLQILRDEMKCYQQDWVKWQLIKNFLYGPLLNTCQGKDWTAKHAEDVVWTCRINTHQVCLLDLWGKVYSKSLSTQYMQNFSLNYLAINTLTLLYLSLILEHIWLLLCWLRLIRSLGPRKERGKIQLRVSDRRTT